jgi:dGTPase
MLIREMLEEAEERNLDDRAAKSRYSKGRARAEESCEMRTDFQRDRDRILYAKSFRRLKHKTQVFISPEGDHYRTRLTHTLEVSQIARTAARSLFLNEDLTEAIALGHDLGHTPFGHAGERVLNRVCPFGFRHNEQSVRVIEVLEKDRAGLNLTWEVRNGIRCHTGTERAATLEGQIVRFADRIAYINHDIEDAIRGGVIRERDIPADCVAVLGESSSSRINAMIVSLVQASRAGERIAMTPAIQEKTESLRRFMFERVYVGSTAKLEEAKAERLLSIVYETLVSQPDMLPADDQSVIAAEGLHRVVCDYVAGMTDPFAVRFFRGLFLPESWNV